MSALPSSRSRSLIRLMLARSFDSAAQAAGEICHLVQDALDVDLVYMTRVDGDEVEMIAVADGIGTDAAPGLRLALSASFCERALAGQGPQSTADLDDSPYADLEWPREYGLRSYAMSPLWDADGRTTGTLSVLDRTSRTFGEDELALLELLGGILRREQELDRSREREAARSAQFEASDRRYRSLVDDLGDIIVEIDAAGSLVYVNPAGTVLMGCAKEDLVGRDMMEQVHPDDRADAARHVGDIIAAGNGAAPESAREVRFVAADGGLRWMSVRGRAVLDDDGGLEGFRGILHDVTARIEAEQQVRAALEEAEAARDEAQRASVAKSEFLSRMSHELRTPLNAILGFGQLLELGELEGEDAENVGQILGAGRHLLDLINEVLDVVRVESGVIGLSLEPVELGAVTTESLDLVRTAATARTITLRAPNRHDGATVVADRQRMKQVLVNLLSNAVKYNVEGGDVVVSWERPGADVLTALPAAEHGWLRLSVRDTGHGIPPERIGDVFTPFDRLGAEGSGIEGTGVGLSLTKTLVEAQGGRIDVASELGRGTVVTVDLPAAAPPAALEEVRGAEGGPTSTILYVEDNPSNITLVRRVLARRPHVRLEVVEDGAEGLEAAHHLRPDLILLDLHLPGMHGATILEKLRASEDQRLREVPIVVVTADLTAGNERRMMDAGASMFLPKPIDVRQLLAVVDDHLSRS